MRTSESASRASGGESSSEGAAGGLSRPREAAGALDLASLSSGQRQLQDAEETSETSSTESTESTASAEAQAPSTLGAASFEALDCQGCLSQFEDAYYCSTTDQVESDLKTTSSAYDYGYCCGGGGADASKTGVAGWKEMELYEPDEEAETSPAGLPLRSALYSAAANAARSKTTKKA